MTLPLVSFVNPPVTRNHSTLGVGTRPPLPQSVDCGKPPVPHLPKHPPPPSSGVFYLAQSVDGKASHSSVFFFHCRLLKAHFLSKPASLWTRFPEICPTPRDSPAREPPCNTPINHSFPAGSLFLALSSPHVFRRLLFLCDPPPLKCFSPEYPIPLLSL